MNKNKLLWLLSFLHEKNAYLDRDVQESEKPELKEHALVMIRESRGILNDIEKELNS